MAQTLGDLLASTARGATKATGLQRPTALVGPTRVTSQRPVQSITPVDKSWIQQPWMEQIVGGAEGTAKSAGKAAKEGGGLLKKVGGWAMDAVGPDVQAYKDVLSGDADLRDLASIGLDAATFIPGAGVGVRMAGKAALKASAKTAGKQGLSHAAKNSAKGSAIRTKKVQTELGELVGGGAAKAKDGAGIIRRQFTDPSLAASKTRGAKSAAGGAKSAKSASPSVLQKGAGKTTDKLLETRKKLALDNQGKAVNKALGRNKARLGVTSTSKTSSALKLALIGARNGGMPGLANGANDQPYEVDLGDGPQQMPGSAMIGWIPAGGGAGGSGSVQPMTVAQAAAAMSAGSLQGGGSWVALS